MVCHMGLTTSGATSGKTLDDCVKLVQELRDEAARRRQGRPVEEVRSTLCPAKTLKGFDTCSSLLLSPGPQYAHSTTRLGDDEPTTIDGFHKETHLLYRRSTTSAQTNSSIRKNLYCRRQRHHGLVLG